MSRNYRLYQTIKPIIRVDRVLEVIQHDSKIRAVENVNFEFRPLIQSQRNVFSREYRLI